ncbi:MAG: tryptophan synthase subunit alpha [Zetaproteobacteria bacterium]|nr:tryptophan synthase subunit alpha [Zetaproteobacteria bacterium]
MSHDRLSTLFARCKTDGRAALVGYLTAGDPSVSLSEQLLLTLAEQVDVIEIGMPFSDPMADGPVIQAASERALAAGTKMDDVFELAAKVRAARADIGIVLMGYANTPYALGFDQFALKAAAAGVDGVLLVDIPAEESAICDEAFRRNHLHRIFLLSPTSSDYRIALAAKHASGFIYYVSLKGITGAEMGAVGDIDAQVKRIRKFTDLPICVGFGIKTPAQVSQVGAFADGVVVGSHFVNQIAQFHGNEMITVQALKEVATSMRSALESHSA